MLLARVEYLLNFGGADSPELKELCRTLRESFSLQPGSWIANAYLALQQGNKPLAKTYAEKALTTKTTADDRTLIQGLMERMK